MPDSVGRLHFFELCRPRLVKLIGRLFCLLFFIFKVGEYCSKCSHFCSAKNSKTRRQCILEQRFPCRSKNFQTQSAQIREICGRPIIRIYAKFFFRELYFFDFFRIYIYHGEFLLRILLNRRVQCQKKSESQTTLCSQPSCRTRGYADHSSSECLE